jgi:hypothetical protein
VARAEAQREEADDISRDEQVFAGIGNDDEADIREDEDGEEDGD